MHLGRVLPHSMTTPTVVGIDPSLTRTALAAIGAHTVRDGGAAPQWHIIATRADSPLPLRLRHLAVECARLVQLYDPALVVVEEPGFYASRGWRGQMAVHRATGAILAAMPHGTAVLVVDVGTVRKELGIHVRVQLGAKASVAEWYALQGIALPAGAGGRPDNDAADADLLARWGQRHLEEAAT